MSLQQTLMSTLRSVMSFEVENKEYLEILAVELVKREMALPEGQLQFDAKIVPMVKIRGFQME